MGRTALIAVAIGGLITTGCGGGGNSSSSPSPAPAASTPQTRTTAGGTPRGSGETIKVGSTNLGKILVGRTNKPLYVFTRDGKGPSKCYGECAKAWPPFLTKGTPQAGSGAKASLVGITKRSDAKLQVTYKGQPVYYYRGDAPGIVRCQAVNEFGGIWYILDAGGAAIRG